MRRITILVAALSLPACAAVTAPSERIAYDVVAAGDDGLTQKLVSDLRARLSADTRFSESAQTVGTLIIQVPNVHVNSGADDSGAYVDVEFQRVATAGEAAARTEQVRVRCRANNVSPCVDAIVSKALVSAKRTRG